MSSDGPPRSKSVERRRRIGLFLLLLGIYLLTASRERPWSDGELMFQVAQALVERHGVEILWATPPYSYAGPDGGIYASFPLLPSIVLVPSVWILRALGPSWQLFSLPLATQLPSALLTAGAGVGFYAMCRRVGLRARLAVVAALFLGLGTFVWVYARRPYSESLQLCLFVLFLLSLMRWRTSRRSIDAALVGMAGGALLNAEIHLGLAALGGFVFVAIEQRLERRPLAPLVTWCACGAIPFVLLFLAYDIGRWGAPLVTGYEAIWELPRESTLWGVFGLALSPGKSIFLYAPPLLLSFFGARGFWRAHRRLALLLLAVTVPPMLAVASLQTWSGGWCWGPRVWLFATPALLLPGAWWLAEVSARGRSSGRAAALAVAGMLAFGGGVVSLLGNSLYWDHHVRLSHHVQLRWLGKPNRSGAILRPVERRTCDPCVEDMHGVLWLPAFQPIVGHAWLVRHVVGGSTSEQALVDAPWARYTTLKVDLAPTLRRAKLDWWGALWIDTFPERRPVGIALLVAFAGLAGAGAWQLRRGLRLPDEPATAAGAGDRGAGEVDALPQRTGATQAAQRVEQA